MGHLTRRHTELSDTVTECLPSVSALHRHDCAERERLNKGLDFTIFNLIQWAFKIKEGNCHDYAISSQEFFCKSVKPKSDTIQEQKDPQSPLPVLGKLPQYCFWLGGSFLSSSIAGERKHENGLLKQGNSDSLISTQSHR